MVDFLRACVEARLNILVSGGTGSGKTTLLNVLSSFIPDDERIVTIEDAAELQLRQEHVVTLETRPANIEGKGAIPIRDLVRNALRMRPDRIIVGECRGGEALDMLQAMNTGHDGSMTTVHANTPRDMLARLETMVLMAGVDLPLRAIREQIASAVDLIVQQDRLQGRLAQDHQHHRGPGHGRRRDRPAGRLHLRADRRRRGQGPGPPQADRRPPEFAEKFEAHGIHLPPRTVREPVLAMDPIVILVAAGSPQSASCSIFVSLAGGSDVNARLERYAARRQASQGDRAGARTWASASPASAALAIFNRVVERRDWGSNMARELARADLALKPSEFLAIRVGAIVGVPLIVHPAQPDHPSVLRARSLWLVGAIVGFWLPKFWLSRRKGKRLKAFNSELADTITLLANSLRAGSSFLQAIEMVVRETQPPISTEFARVIREVNLGLPLDEALANLGRRVQSDDLELMITAIAIQHRSAATWPRSSTRSPSPSASASASRARSRP